MGTTADKLNYLLETKTAIKDAIVVKGGTVADDATFRSFAESVAAIKGGSGNIDALVDKSLTEIDSNVTLIGDYAFYRCKNLTSVNFPLATSVGVNAFQLCTALESVNLPEATSISSKAFLGTNSLTRVRLPKVTKISENAFGTSGLKFADFTALTSIGAEAFSLSESMKALILRGDTVVSLANTNIFSRAGCYIYVPAALVDSYKAATNWGDYSIFIRALEDYTVDGTITGELDETKI